MPKAKYAERGKVKPKSVKSKGPATDKRREAQFGKKLKKGTNAASSVYIGRTKAVKKLQVTLRDFRRLCILKGIYPRDPKSKKMLDPHQTYYHFKDIQYLMHEPLMRKFREQQIFLRRLKRLVGRREIDSARHLAAAKPTYTLDHLIKERYPRFMDALGDIDDALSLTSLFASFPAEHPVKAAHTSVAKRLSREWAYMIARTHALRKVFFTIKGTYFEAQVQGVTIIWLVPWSFSQQLPADVDYNVMLTFLDLHEVTLKFVLFKLYHEMGLSYPPRLNVAREDGGGGALSLLDVAEVVGAGAGAAAGSNKGATATASATTNAAPGKVAFSKEAAVTVSAVSEETAARLASLKSKMNEIVAKPGAAEGGAGERRGGAGGGRGRFAGLGPSSTTLYDFVDAEAEAEAAAVMEGGGGVGGGGDDDISAFADSAEAKSLLATSAAKVALARIFGNLIFFLGREVPRDIFEFIVCAFGGRVGWEGPGSPYAVTDTRITHHVWDRSPALPNPKVEGREYVAPQWLADCVNARLLLPISKYAPGATLPPHLSPFVDDAATGHTPAYRGELDELRAAAAVTGRLADVLPTSLPIDAESLAANASRKAKAIAAAKTNSRLGAAGDAEEDQESDDEDEDEEGGEEGDNFTLSSNDMGGDDSSDSDNDNQDDEDVDEVVAAALTGGAAKRARTERSAAVTAAAEDERRTLAASVMSRTQKKVYDEAMAKKSVAAAGVATLAARRKEAAAKGDSGTGKAPASTVVAGGGAKKAAPAAPPAKKAAPPPPAGGKRARGA